MVRGCYLSFFSERRFFQSNSFRNKILVVILVCLFIILFIIITAMTLIGFIAFCNIGKRFFFSFSSEKMFYTKKCNNITLQTLNDWALFVVKILPQVV